VDALIGAYRASEDIKRLRLDGPTGDEITALGTDFFKRLNQWGEEPRADEMSKLAHAWDARGRDAPQAAAALRLL
jgi:hypothetical protein